MTADQTTMRATAERVRRALEEVAAHLKRVEERLAELERELDREAAQ